MKIRSRQAYTAFTAFWQGKEERYPEGEGMVRCGDLKAVGLRLELGLEEERGGVVPEMLVVVDGDRDNARSDQWEARLCHLHQKPIIRYISGTRTQYAIPFLNPRCTKAPRVI